MNNLQDHRLLGAKYELFSFFEDFAPGLPVWNERGLRIKNALISKWKNYHQESGYQEIESPILLDKELWKISGHCDYFEENMYFSSVDKRDYAIKPMNCPGAILHYKSKRRDLAELPLRICELGHVHRHELSGSLHGLLRVRSFVQDDAHVFCSEDQLLNEVRGVIRLIKKIMSACELHDYRFELSLRGEGAKYLGNCADWEFAQNILRESLNLEGHDFIEREGEAKFYGPSLDLHFNDKHGRSWQCSSIQLDFNLPERFGLKYFDEGVKKAPFMLHRAIFGSLERFIGILLEHFGMDLPLWMHPVAYKIICVKESVASYAKEIAHELQQMSLAVEVDFSDEELSLKIKKAFNSGAKEILIIGEKESQSQRVSLKRAGLIKERGEFMREVKASL